MPEPHRPKVNKWVVLAALLSMAAAMFAGMIYKVGQYGP